MNHIEFTQVSVLAGVLGPTTVAAARIAGDKRPPTELDAELSTQLQDILRKHERPMREVFLDVCKTCHKFLP